MSRKEFKALGSQRESLSTNPLLIRAQTGKVKTRCFSLPPVGFTYGMQNERLDGGVAEVMVWNTLQSSSKDAASEAPKDFLTLNKRSVQSGLTTALEQTTFRKKHDIRRKEAPPREKKVPSAPPDVVFGISTRPSTPVFELLAHRYQEEWLEETRKREKKRKDEMKGKKLNGKVYETRASLLRHYSEPVECGPLWKMSKFTKIPSSLQTFRTEQERTAAFVSHASDATSRTGVFGHGVYQPAHS